MEVSLTRYEESYEQYKAHRKQAEGKCLKSLMFWVLALPFAVFFGLWADDTFLGILAETWEEILGSVLILMDVMIMVGWFWGSFAGRNHRINRLTHDMSMKLMEQGLTETFGPYTRENVKYPVMQIRCCRDPEVKRNECLSWKSREMPLLIHRARITNGETGEDEEIYFDGWALSIPAPEGWENRDRKKWEKSMQKTWKTPFETRIADRAMFSLDTIGGRTWLTVGFAGLRLGEKNVSWWDLSAWYRECAADVALFARAEKLFQQAKETELP